MRIRGTLLRFNDHSLPENFVSLAVRIDNENYEPYHAAILIRHKKIDYLHHFPGGDPPIVVENFNEHGWYIYKILKSSNNNDPSEIGAILQYCKRICTQTNITYSFIADGSSYSETGDFLSKLGLPEFGTCVGFCLNTLSGIIIDVDDSLVELTDWDDSEINFRYDAWSQAEARKKYPNLDWNLYYSVKKRITPTEYLCVSYFDEFPIRKASISQIKNSVLEEIKKIYSPD
ncbi:hypothetical protein GO730_20975 [Spirosoma sp. HMF3257]|uniref:Uncharacterized protein n=1 Tax=Spirosoma telluris TaxID=2183553 RepID=A0A327NLE4_9BACT|nr:hypothetical protein [Spirosoma telluris]RAI76022.1 hypothetical protein HMF3257_20900 [Spirosoma telluris]